MFVKSTYTDDWQAPSTMKTAKLPDRHFKTVLLYSDIYLLIETSPLRKDKIYITASGYEKVLVPESILDKYATIALDYFVKGKPHFFESISFEKYIIDECLRQAVFYHPFEVSTFLI